MKRYKKYEESTKIKKGDKIRIKIDNKYSDVMAVSDQYEDEDFGDSFEYKKGNSTGIAYLTSKKKWVAAFSTDID